MRRSFAHALLAFMVTVALPACGSNGNNGSNDLYVGGGGNGGGGGGGSDDMGVADDMAQNTTGIPSYPLRDLLHDAPYLDVNASYRFRIAAMGTGWGAIGLEVPRTVPDARIDLWTDSGVYLGGTSGGWTCDSGGSSGSMSPSRTLFIAFNSAKRGKQTYYAVVQAGGMQYSVEWYEATTKIPFSSTTSCNNAANEDCTMLPAGHVAHAVDLDLVPGNNYNLKHDENCSCSNSTAQTFQFIVDSGGLRGDVGSSEKYEYVAAQCGKCGSDEAGIGADPGSDALHGVVLIDSSGPSRNPVNVCYQAQAITCGATQQMCGVACVDPQTTTNACGASCTNCNSTVSNATGQTCVAATCDYGACAAGYIDCDGNRANGCEKACTGMNATGLKCGAASTCDYATCNAGFSDCDGTRSNGCEHPGKACPVQLVASANAGATLAVDSTYVYWADSSGSAIKRAPIAAPGVVQTLTSVPVTANRIAINATNIYFTASNAVAQIPLAGGTITPLQASETGALGIFVDANAYYWTDAGNPGSVKMQPFAGGSPVIIATMTANQPGTSPNNVISDGTNAYWTGTDGTAWQAPLTGAGPTVRLDQPGTNNGNGDLQIAVDGTSVYWSVPQLGVYKNLIGAGNELQLLSTYYASHAIAVDATHVYYGLSYNQPGIYGMAKDGTGVYAVDGNSAGGGATAMALDATYVYYVIGASIYKAPK